MVSSPKECTSRLGKRIYIMLGKHVKPGVTFILCNGREVWCELSLDERVRSEVGSGEKAF